MGSERLVHLTCGQLGPPSTLSLATRLPDSQLEDNLGRSQPKLGQLGPNLGRLGVQLGSILGPTWALLSSLSAHYELLYEGRSSGLFWASVQLAVGALVR